jgi:hypothetical protein
VVERRNALRGLSYLWLRLVASRYVASFSAIQITFVVAKLRLSFRGFSAPLAVAAMGVIKVYKTTVQNTLENPAKSGT